MSDEMLFAPDNTSVSLRRDLYPTRAKARYAGYRALDDEVGIGVFYPDEFRVIVAWLRPIFGRGDEEFTHEVCARTDPDAAAYWSVEYVERKREWRDGQWRAVA